MKWVRKPTLKQILLILLLTEILLISYPVFSWIFPSSTTITLNANTRYNPTQAQTTDSNNIYTIKTAIHPNNVSFAGRALRITMNGNPYYINITSGTNGNINIWQWFTASSTVLEYTTTGTYITQIYVGSLGAPTVTGADTSSWNAGTNIITFTTTPSSSQTVYLIWGSYSFMFHGVYNETTGLQIPTGSIVTAHYTDGTVPTSFFVNGTYSYSSIHRPEYFSFQLSSSTQVSQSVSNIYIYNQSTYYDILFPQIEPNTNYEVGATLTWNSTYTVSNKATTGCRINFGTPPNPNGYINYYVYRTTSSKERQYWLGDTETTGNIYIFDDDLTTYYLLFLDLAGVLPDQPYVYAEYYVNGTLYIVEKRKVDVETKLAMQLKLDRRYTLSIVDGSSYTFGELLTTTSTTITLSLRGIDFPKETLLIYKYVRIYGLRAFGTPNGNISITYQDTLNMTNDVLVCINYRNGTNAYNTTQTVSTFIVNWLNAENDTDYQVTATIDHQRYGVYDWKQYFGKSYTTNPWILGWLGILPFNINYLIGIFIVIVIGGSFSMLNPAIGAFLATCAAAALTLMGWLPVAPGFLITAFCFSIMFGIVWARRKVTYG